ncbi:MAG TPA: ABC transporter permease subunit/CPBP intramembrane protease [Planctomycetaceae bacterium]|nr:ABC transporter permease subunit/CPBP intramembrane protease [Planctomycetaceae bacterium]
MTSSSVPPADAPPSSRKRAARGVAPRFLRLMLKELRETLRDRRTIATLILMPLLVYPLLSVAFERFLLSSLKAVPGHSQPALGFISDAEAHEFAPYLLRGSAILGPSEEERARHLGGQTKTSTVPLNYEVVNDLKQSVLDGRVDVGVRVRKAAANSQDKQKNPERGIDCELIYDPQSAASRDAYHWVERCLGAINQRSLERQLREKGIDSRLVPVQASVAPIEAAGESSAVSASHSLSALVPLILILMTITGAVYPAIDLTAGERERGTLEMLVAAPVPRMQLLLGKYLTVLIVALLTAVVNLAAMMVTIASIGMTPLLFGPRGISFEELAEITALLVLFAAFFSAVLLAVTSFARSFKEAQAYLIPLMLASIAPGMLSMIPGLKLQGPLAVTPLVNIVLLARDLLQHTVDPVTALWVVISTGLFALAAIGVAARIFGTDAILYGSHGTWSDLFRRPRRASAAPTATSGLLGLAIIFPTYFLASNLLSRSTLVGLDGRLWLAALVEVLVFLQIPLALAVLNRVDLSTGFRLKPAPVAAFAGALVLGVSLWPFAHQIVVWLIHLEITDLDPRMMAAAEQLLAKIKEVSPALLIFTLGIVPAVCEEFFFRGYLLSSLRRSKSAPRAVLLSSALFGIFHLVATDRLQFERLAPSTALGLVLGWLCIRCGSLLPGMLLHASHNSLILAAAHYQKELAAWGLGLGKATDVRAAALPTSWLIAGAIGTVIGFAVIQLGTRNVAARATDETEAPLGLRPTLADQALHQGAQLAARPGDPPA